MFVARIAVLNSKISEILWDDKQKVPLSTEDQSRVGLRMHKPGSCPATRRLKAKAESSRLVSYNHLYGYKSLVGLQHSVLSADVVSVYLETKTKL